ncbi:hypothetical protein JCM11491_004052 [Sporobolomyces phaffii]
MTPHPDLDALIASLESASPLGDEPVATLVTLVQEQGGLGRVEYSRVLDCLLGSHAPLSTLLHLTHALIPLGSLSAEIVLRIVSSLGEPAHSRGIEYPVQRRLLQHLAVLHRVSALATDGIDALKRCYAVVEKGLDYESLRDPTADLLHLILTPRFASTTRLARIERMARTTKDPHGSLNRLADKYRSLLHPDASLSSRVVTPLASPPLNRDPDLDLWTSCVMAIFSANAEHGSGVLMNGRETKRRKLKHDSIAQLELERLARRIDRPVRRFHSELPSTLSAKGAWIDSVEWTRTNSWNTLLDRGYGQDPDYFIAIYNRLSAAIFDYRTWQLLVEDETNRGSREDPTWPIFEWLLSLCEVSGELPEQLQPLLAERLKHWNGTSARSLTFGLLTHLKAPRYQTLNEQFMDPLVTLSKDADSDWVCDCIRSLTTLVMNWSIRDDLDLDPDCPTAYGKTTQVVTTLAAMQGVLEAIDKIVELVVNRLPDCLELRMAALESYEKSLDLALVFDLPVVVVPSQAFAYSCLFGNEVSCMSRMSGIIARLREALTGDKTAIPVEDPLYTGPIMALNTLLVDFGNPLWKRQFLVESSAEEGNAGMGLSDTRLEQLRNLAVRREQFPQSALGLTTHGALASLAVDFLQVLALREGKTVDQLLGAVSTATLKHLNNNTSPLNFRISFTNFRPLFLEHLRDRGATGLYDFLFSSMQSLIKRRESQAS